MIAAWSVKTLLRARLRAAGSILAVAAAFLLVITFKAVWQGESEQLVRYLERAEADVWVMQPHVSNMHMATSFISEGKRFQIENVDGVDAVNGILYLNTFVHAGDAQWFCYVVGIEREGQLGGPWSMVSGRAFPKPGEAVIPAVLARISDLELGDEVKIADRSFEIVGLSSDTFSVGNPITFVHASDLGDLLSLIGYDSYALVRAEPGVDHRALAARIREQVDDVQALPTSDFIDNDRILVRQMGTELIGLLTVISAVLATVLVSFALYMHTARLRRDLAVLKAVGFRSRHVYGSVLLQAALLTGSAFLLAVLLASALVALAPQIAPILSLSITAESLWEIGATGLLVAAIATLALARRVAKVDPLSVFHA